MSENELESYLLSLFIRRGEIDRLEAEIRELLTGCSNPDQIEIVKHVLENVLIISSDRLTRPINHLADKIMKSVQDNGPTAVVAMAYDSSPDSSQMLLQLLKPALYSKPDLILLNTVPSYLKKDNLDKFPNCILIDEFIGTGLTLRNRIKHINDDCAARGRSCMIKSICLFGMRNAYNALKADNFDVDFIQILEAGIAGYFTGEDRTRLVAAMESLEAQLAPELSGKPLPSLGHGGAEAMFNITGWNAPNSNFPILWWPQNLTGHPRQTMMKRYEP